MLHHHMTKYTADGKLFIVSWLQLNFFGFRWCFSKRRLALEGC